MHGALPLVDGRAFRFGRDTIEPASCALPAAPVTLGMPVIDAPQVGCQCFGTLTTVETHGAQLRAERAHDRPAQAP
jgi:hypothetical protein